MSTGCEFYADALVDRAAGVLDAERAARVDEHVSACPECAHALRVITTLKASPVEVPADLEARIRTAVRAAAAAGVPVPGSPAAPPASRQPAGPARRRRASWRPWTLPLAAAAAMAGLWIGVGMPGVGPADPDGPAVAALDDYDPYGGWPADGVIVAGDPVWSDLSVDELEHLLREMES